MNKNQKIALGCGVAGCLGLIVAVIVGVVGYFLWARSSQSDRTYNTNVSSNRNSNSDSDSNSNANENSNTTTNSNSTSGATSASSLSDDDKHKLYQAALSSGDTELLRRVSVKLGLMDEDFTPGDEYVEFVKDHAVWALRNTEFIQSVNTREKAVAYVNQHFPN